MNIPGLNIEDIANNIIDFKHSDILNKIEDEEERENKRNELVKYYTETDAGALINREIENIKSGCDTLIDIISYLQQAIISIPMPSKVPQVIVVGQAVGSINPTWSNLFSAAIKPSLLICCTIADYILKDIKDSCETINFNPPEVINGIENQLESYKTSIINI